MSGDTFEAWPEAGSEADKPEVRFDRSGGESPLDLPRALRPREKLFARGPDVLSHGELVALVLGSGTRAHPVSRIARRLVSRYGLGGLAGLSAEAWRSQGGLGPVSAARTSKPRRRRKLPRYSR